MRLLSRLVRSLIRVGRLTVIDSAGGRYVVEGAPGPQVSVRLHDKDTGRRLALLPQLYLGEAYMDGSLTVEDGGDIYDLLQLLMINGRSLYGHPFIRFLDRIRSLCRRLQQRNPVARARRNVAHHYDLSGQLYDLFLDSDRQYSCAYFATAHDSLEQAQENKKRHLAAKLLLEPGMRVLDIGSGWGGLAIYLAQLGASEVIGVTLSSEQQRIASERAAAAGLAGRVRFHLQDYRQIEGRFDRIVSVGMFEHVGLGHYPEFFAKLKQLLAEDGVALLHAIGRTEGPGVTNAWLAKHIFPGGYSPALSEVLPAVEKSGFWVTDLEILRLHYAYTLREWRRRFAANRGRIKAIYDERFCRMWEFYLAAGELAFSHQDHMVWQLQLARDPQAVPITRDYMFDWERAQPSRARLAI